MNNLTGEKKFCFMCMQEHFLETVELLECIEYRGVEVYYTAKYQYCPISDEHIESESMMKINRASIKEAYTRLISLNKN